MFEGMHVTGHYASHAEEARSEGKGCGVGSWGRHPTKVWAAFTVHHEDVVAVLAGFVAGVKGEAVPTQAELRHTVLTLPVGIALVLVGEEPEVLGALEGSVEGFFLSVACAPR